MNEQQRKDLDELIGKIYELFDDVVMDLNYEKKKNKELEAKISRLIKKSK